MEMIKWVNDLVSQESSGPKNEQSNEFFNLPYGYIKMKMNQCIRALV